VREEVIVPHSLLAPALVLLLQAAPPLPEQFRSDPPTHVLRIVRVSDGAPVRLESFPGAGETAFPPGEAGRLLTALTGIETGALDADLRIPCDSTCWGDGSHGSPTLAEAIAVGCDAWFHRESAEPSPDEVAERAVALGFSRADREAGGWAATAREWTEFWRSVRSGRNDLAPAATAAVLTAGALSVSSPRGVARPLHDPRRRVQAVAGAADAGAWVTGLVRRGHLEWAFALWVPDGTVPLAVTRAASLLDETIRRREEAAAERGSPLAPLGER